MQEEEEEQGHRARRVEVDSSLVCSVDYLSIILINYSQEKCIKTKCVV